MHEGLIIEDGAFVDGKFKRTDRTKPEETEEEESDSSFDSEPQEGMKLLQNIRLIR